MDLLAVLYHDNHNIENAVELLRESRMLCEENGVRFDAGDLLEE